jgi:hypothetical protein
MGMLRIFKNGRLAPSCVMLGRSWDTPCMLVEVMQCIWNEPNLNGKGAKSLHRRCDKSWPADKIQQCLFNGFTEIGCRLKRASQLEYDTSFYIPPASVWTSRGHYFQQYSTRSCPCQLSELQDKIRLKVWVGTGRRARRKCRCCRRLPQYCRRLPQPLRQLCYSAAESLSPTQAATGDYKIPLLSLTRPLMDHNPCHSTIL